MEWLYSTDQQHPGLGFLQPSPPVSKQRGPPPSTNSFEMRILPRFPTPTYMVLLAFAAPRPPFMVGTFPVCYQSAHVGVLELPGGLKAHSLYLK